MPRIMTVSQSRTRVDVVFDVYNLAYFKTQKEFEKGTKEAMFNNILPDNRLKQWLKKLSGDGTDFFQFEIS